MQNLHFKKEERLCSVKLLSTLFKDGSSFLFYPFRVTWITSTEPQAYPAQVLISVPKKRFKRSVDRNLLKRRMREAYRLNKSQLLYPLLLDHNKKVLLALTYVSNEILDSKYISSKMGKMMKSLEKNMFQL